MSSVADSARNLKRNIAAWYDQVDESHETDDEIRARIRADMQRQVRETFDRMGRVFAEVHASRPRFDPRRLGDRYVVWRITSAAKSYEAARKRDVR